MNLETLILQLDVDADKFNAKLDRAVARVNSSAGGMTRAMSAFALDNKVTRAVSDLTRHTAAWGDVARDTMRDVGRGAVQMGQNVRRWAGAIKDTAKEMGRDIKEIGSGWVASAASSKALYGPLVAGTAIARRARVAAESIGYTVADGLRALGGSQLAQSLGRMFGPGGPIGGAVGRGISAAITAAPGFLARGAGAVGRGAAGAVGVAGSAVSGIMSAGGSLISGLGSVATSLPVIGALAVGLLGLGTIAYKAGEAAITLAMDYEKAAIAFEVMTGSAEKGQKVLADLTQLAIETPFKLNEVIGGAKQLKAFGVETEQLVPTMRNLGNVAAGTGTDIGRIILAFGQVGTAGRLMGTELRQFTEAGVPLIDYLAKVMGKPPALIRAMVQEGRVGFNDVIKAFNMMSASGGAFHGMMDRLAETSAGRWNSFVETIQLGLRNVGLSFIKGFGLADLLKEWTDAIDTGGGEKMEGFFRRVREGFDLVVAAGGVGLRMLADTMKEFVQTMTGATPAWDDFRTAAAVTIQAVGVGMANLINMIKDIVGGIAKMLLAAGEAMNAAGLGKGDNPAPESTYLFARQQGGSKAASALAQIGTWFADETGILESQIGSESFQRRGQTVAKSVNPLAQGAAALTEFSGNKLDPTKWGEQFATAMANTMVRKEDKNLAGQGAVGGLFAGAEAAKRMGNAATDMAGKIQAGSEAMKLMAGVVKDTEKGFTGFEQVAKQLDHLNELVRGGVGAGAEAVIGGPLGGALLNKGAGNINERQMQHVAGGIYKTIMAGMHQSDALPGYHMEGTANAQDTINRSIYQHQNTVQEDIRAGVDQLIDMRKEQERIDKEALDALNDLRRRGIIPGRF